MSGVNAYNTMATSLFFNNGGEDPIFGKCLLDFVRNNCTWSMTSLFASKAPQATGESLDMAINYSHRELNERQQRIYMLKLAAVVTKLGDNANDVYSYLNAQSSGVYTGTAQKRSFQDMDLISDAFNGTIHCSHIVKAAVPTVVVAATSFTAVFASALKAQLGSLKQLLAILNSMSPRDQNGEGNGLGGLSTMLSEIAVGYDNEGCLDMFAPREAALVVSHRASWGADARPDVSKIDGSREAILFVKRLNKQDRKFSRVAEYLRQLLLLAAFAEIAAIGGWRDAEIVVSLVDSQTEGAMAPYEMRFTGQKPVVNGVYDLKQLQLLDTNQVQVYPRVSGTGFVNADFAITVEHSPSNVSDATPTAAVMPLEDGAVVDANGHAQRFGRIAGYLGTLNLRKHDRYQGKVLDAEWARTLMGQMMMGIMEAHGLTNANFMIINSVPDLYYTITELFNKDVLAVVQKNIFFERGQSLRLKETTNNGQEDMGSAAYVAGQWQGHWLYGIIKSNEYLNAFRWGTIAGVGNEGIRNISTYAMHFVNLLDELKVKVQTAVPGTSTVSQFDNAFQQNNTQTQDTAPLGGLGNETCNHY
ncbi:hypothetical protein SPFM12_00283 [Salmonella phage SPFM12]|nr:hypothetical protein SPFM12_00283 [Salmonella phage SPFM12]